MKTLKTGCLLFGLFCFLSCRNESRPEGILPEKKMEEVLWDMNRADMLVDTKSIRDSTLNKKEESLRLYEDIFAIHKTNQQQVKTSLTYYQSNPALIKKMLDSLVARQQRSMQDAYNPQSPSSGLQSAAPPVPAPVTDSVLRARDSIRNIYKKYQQQGQKKQWPVPASVQ